MDGNGLTEYQIMVKAETMSLELTTLAKKYTHGIVEKVEIILDYPRTEIVGNYRVFSDEDYAVVYANNRRTFLNITGDSDWCIVEEVIKAVSREVF